MATIILESGLEARVLAEEGYGLMTAPWELVQAIRTRAAEIRSAATGGPRPAWQWTEEADGGRSRAA